MKVNPMGFVLKFKVVSGLKHLQPVFIADSRTLHFFPSRIGRDSADFTIIRVGKERVSVPTFRDREHLAGFAGNLHGQRMGDLIRAGFMPLTFRDSITQAHMDEMGAVKEGIGLALYYVSDMKLYVLGDKAHSVGETEKTVGPAGDGDLTAVTLSSGNLIGGREVSIADEKTVPDLSPPIAVYTMSLKHQLPTTAMTGGKEGEIDLGFAVGVTNKGARTANEDGFLVYRDPASRRVLLMVADGMGGYSAGEVASEMCIRGLFSNLLERKGIEESIHSVDLWIHLEAMLKSDFEGMGTTVDVVAIEGNSATVGHVGDSFVYRVKSDGRVELLARPHTPAMGILMGLSLAVTMSDFDERRPNIKAALEEQAPDFAKYVFNDRGGLKTAVPNFSFPMEGEILDTLHLFEIMFPPLARGSITSVVGHGDVGIFDEVTLELEDGDWIVMVTDGMQHAIDYFTKFHAYLAQLRREGKSIQEAMRKIFEVAGRKWSDNVTAVFYEHRKTEP